LLLFLLLTPLAGFMLLRSAPVQTALAHAAASYLSKELNTEVVIGNFRLNWFLEVVITDIKILDRHQKVLLKAAKIRADVKSLDLRNRKLDLNEIALTKADVNLVYYEADSCMNLQFIIDHFSSSTVDTTPSKPLLLSCYNLKLLDTHFSLHDERYAKPGKGIDFADMDFSKINLEVRNISFPGDSIVGDFRQFTCKEKSGFRLDDFSTQAIVCPRGITAKALQITTAKSRLSLDLIMEYNHWGAFDEFLDSVRIFANFKPSQLDMSDIVSFASDVDGMNNIIDFSGKIRGTVSSFTARNFQFAFGSHTSFKGEIAMNGLPDLAETFIKLKVDKFETDVNDIQSFTLPYTEGINKITLPHELLCLGNVLVNGRFTGFYNDFVSKATFKSDVGLLTTDLLLSNNRATHTSEYNGKILLESFDAGKVFNVQELGTLNLYALIKGKNFSLEKADLTVKSEITNLQYQGNTFGLINVDGEFRHKRFTGGVFINDKLLGLDFNGSADFSEELPAFDFVADISHANLARLNLITGDSVAMLSTNADLKFQGNTIDNLLGTMRFSNTSFAKGNHILNLKQLALMTTSLENGGKQMEFKSDFADAVFTGQYTFDDMADYLTLVFTEFIPALSSGEKVPVRVNRGSFDYTIRLHHTDSVTAMFAPWIKIHENTVISGKFDPALGLVNVTGQSPLIVLGGIALHQWTLEGNSSNKSLNVEMNCHRIDGSVLEQAQAGAKKIEQFRLNARVADDSVHFGIGWNDMDSIDHNKADIAGVLSFKQNPRLILKIDRAEIVLNDTSWKSIPDNLLVFDSSYIEARNFGFYNKSRKVVIDGSASADPLSKLTLKLDHFNLSYTDAFTKELGFDMDGYMDGMVSVSELYSVPHFTSDLTVSKFGFNHESLGDAIIKSEWDSKNSALGIDLQVVYIGNAGTHYPIKVKGNIFPENEHNNFDLNILVNNLKVGTVQPFLESIFSRMRGYASGAMTLTGDFSDPVLKGKVNLMRTEVLIDYLRTSYSFTGDFNFDKDKMWIKDIVLTDSTFGKGIVSGTIRHKAFADWALDIELEADNLAALNTPYNPNELYYGRAKATGTLTLKGPIEDLVMKANVKSEKGTSVYIPISFARSLSENSFIRYRNHVDSIADARAVVPVESSIFALQLGLDVSRNAEIGIILPYQMGTIDVRGSGLVNLGIDSRGEYSMFGQYIMDNGDFMFNFQNLLTKNFGIQRGSTITFNGSPYDADINMQAIYKVKTSLSGIPDIPEESKSTRVKVDCIINLTGNLYNPEIKFSLALPEENETVKRQVFASIDTTNALEMNQQMISLLVLNAFSSPSGVSSTDASLGLSSYEIVSAQLSKMLSQISKDFDIGVNYRPGDQMSPQELEVALSTQLFDNRVTIDGAVGMNTYTATANQTNQFIGDVLVEVKITEDGRFRGKAFNRTNSALDLSSGYSPYTQGVGVLFRKDFNSISELFKRKKKIPTPDNKPPEKK